MLPRAARAATMLSAEGMRSASSRHCPCTRTIPFAKETRMSLDILADKGTPLDRQVFTWRELAGPTYSKLDDDAFARVRVILMNGVEAESIRFSHACARMQRDLRVQLARVRRIEQHQQT